MGYGDIQEGGEDYEWAKAIEEAVKGIEEATGGKLKFEGMKPFDKYQGPYASVTINGSPDTIWDAGVEAEEVLFVENKGWIGFAYRIADAVDGDEQAIEELEANAARAAESPEGFMEEQQPYEKTVDYKRKNPELPLEGKRKMSAFKRGAR